MKVLLLAVLVIGSACGRGSGPYLPSGWRPDGPAFDLPTETEKPVPLKDAPVQAENESSGSSQLREYGPPKVESAVGAKTEIVENSQQEVSQDLTVQSLPDPITEQAFVVIEAKFNEADKAAEVSQEDLSQATENTQEDETSTQSESVISGKSLNIETQTESSVTEERTTEIAEVEIEEERSEEAGQKNSDVNAEVKQENENVVAAVKKTEEVEVKTVNEEVNNIADALANLENEIKTQQVQTIQEVPELRSVEDNSGSVQQTPEGFLEYGPPGFTEYGPPKGDLTSVVKANSPEEATFETNESRRRRFSPKFKKISKKH